MPAHTQLHFLTKKNFAGILNQNPYIDKLWLLDEDLNQITKDLKKEGFDFVIDLHNNLRTRRIKWKLGVKSFTLNKINWKKFLMTRFKINVLPSRHIVDREMDTVRHLGVFNDGLGLDYFYPESQTAIEAHFPELKSLRFVALAVGGQHFTKRMPVSKLQSLIDGIQQKVVVLGGKEDAEVGEQLFKHAPDKVINLAGKSNLHQSAGIVNLAAAIITHDTGIMHIAAALKKPILAVWGNTIPEFGMYPYYGDTNVEFQNFEVQGLKCRPCSKIGFDHCPKGHFNCMQTQSVEAIAAVANKWSL